MSAMYRSFRADSLKVSSTYCFVYFAGPFISPPS